MVVGFVGYTRNNDTAAAQSAPCSGPGQFVRGEDKETGEPICGTVTGCPYGDSIPLGPECDKHAPASDKDLENSLPDPNRDYYDECGNLYTYDGKLKERVANCTPFTEIQGK